MKTNDVFPSNYLKAEDDMFENGEVIATIKDVKLETLTSQKGEEDKPIMFFKEYEKGLVVNKTNWKVCEKLFAANDSDKWLGERVILTTVDVDAFGDVVRAIRIKNQRPPADKKALLEHYQKLWERGKKANMEGIENYVISPDLSAEDITTIGKELRTKVEAAETFS
jgi:hypothetical protein